jgi:hypothetical protein
MPTQMTSAGSAVDYFDSGRAWFTLVPWQVLEAEAMIFSGRYHVGVYYWVIQIR